MLYAFGSNGAGQLGVGDKEDRSEAVLVTPSDSSWQVLQLAAGGNHTIILCSDGEIRAMGNNEDGRCGIEAGKELLRPTKISLPLEKTGEPVKAKQVTATWSSTAFLSAEGTVLVCGSGHSGELGLGPGIRKVETPHRIPAFPPPGTKVIFLASGMGHTVAILSNMEVYGWGKGRKGQLGEPKDDVWWPRKIDSLRFGAKAACCGKDFTFIAGESFTGQMAVLGPNGNDRFGIRANAPTALSGQKSISAAWNSVYALKASGDILAWGRNDYEQLPPQGLPEVESFAAGSEHCLALTRSNQVLAWGWGEHGNCGKRPDVPVDSTYGWNHIKVPGRVNRVFAGCATSFIETAGIEQG